MNVERYSAQVKNTVIETKDCHIEVTDWANLEGINVIITGKNLQHQGTLVMTHEATSALKAALATHEICE